jgi:hypothetical protein
MGLRGMVRTKAQMDRNRESGAGTRRALQQAGNALIHYISILSGSDFTPQNRGTIVKLLVAEEHTLSHDPEHYQLKGTPAEYKAWV